VVVCFSILEEIFPRKSLCLFYFLTVPYYIPHICISLADKIYMYECLISHDFKLAVFSESLNICMVYINLRCAYIEQQNPRIVDLDICIVSSPFPSTFREQRKLTSATNPNQLNIQTSEKAT
jgi:hypothetical protein